MVTKRDFILRGSCFCECCSSPYTRKLRQFDKKTLIANPNSRDVFWHARALNLFKKIRSCIVIRSTLNLTVTPVYELCASVTLYLIFGVNGFFRALSAHEPTVDKRMGIGQLAQV